MPFAQLPLPRSAVTWATQRVHPNKGVFGGVVNAHRAAPPVHGFKHRDNQSPFMTAHATCMVGRPSWAVVWIVMFRAEQ